MRAEAALPVHPPRYLLLVAALFAAGSVLLRLPAHEWAYAIGYVAGTVGGLGAVVAFSRQDLRRRQSAWYSPARRLERVRAAITVICVAAACSHAWALASEWAA